jgi:hypothetical protein
MNKTIAHLKQNGVSVKHSDRIYYHKYPYRVDMSMLGSVPSHADIIKGKYRHGQGWIVFVEDIRDVERLVEVGRTHGKFIDIAGPMSEAHDAALSDHVRETQLIRKQKWYKKYDIRLSLALFRGSDELVDFVSSQLSQDEYYIYYIRVWPQESRQAVTIYINSENCEDIIGMIKMQFHQPGPIMKFERAVIVE